MCSMLCHAIVLLTAVSTLFAGVPSRAVANDTGGPVVSAQKPASDDDASKPRGESDTEESEEEGEFEVKLLAERSIACGPRTDVIVPVDLVNGTGVRRLAWPTALIRGPPASA